MKALQAKPESYSEIYPVAFVTNIELRTIVNPDTGAVEKIVHANSWINPQHKHWPILEIIPTEIDTTANVGREVIAKVKVEFV